MPPMVAQARDRDDPVGCGSDTVDFVKKLE
jgi:hypothetical protein